MARPELKSIVLVSVIVAVVAGSLWFFVNINTQEDELVSELKATLYSLHISLEEVSGNKEYVSNRNFPTGILESGLEQTQNVSDTLDKLNNLRDRKEKLLAGLTLGFSGIKENKYPETEKTLATLKNIENEINWWRYFQKGTQEIMTYNPDADLKNRSATEQKRDFIFRLYLAKAGLLKSMDHFKKIEKLSEWGETARNFIKQEAATVSTIDSLILAVDKNKIEESAIIKETYLRQFKSMKAEISGFITTAYKNNRFQMTAKKLKNIVDEL